MTPRDPGSPLWAVALLVALAVTVIVAANVARAF